MRKLFTFTTLFLVALCLPLVGMAQDAAVKAQVDRTELPIKAPWYPPITTLDARDAKAPPVFEVKAPKNAPNVVVILLDDLGFGGTTATGGVVPTPPPLRQARQPGSRRVLRLPAVADPQQAFFVYFASGAVHEPHHVPQSYIDKRKGKFDEGWDVIRNWIFEQGTGVLETSCLHTPLRWDPYI